MTKPVLFVCKSCNSSSKEDLEPSEGTCLIDRLNELNPDNKIEIKAVTCMWMCERPCVAALSVEDEFTYLFTDLPSQETPEALLQVVDLCLKSKGKTIAYKKFPQVLKSANIARIPAM